MEAQQPRSEALELLTASDEDAVFVDSSDPDSGDSEDEAEFTGGTDPSHDSVEDAKEETAKVSCSDDACCSPEGRRGGSLSSTNRDYNLRKRPRLEVHSGDGAGWKSEAEPDELPHSILPFLPTREPGVQPPLSDCKDSPSPSELFKMYFGQAAVKTLCVNTNKNAAKNAAEGKKFKWIELTEAEMYQYIGMTLYMGILKLPKLSDYWRTSSIFHVPYPQKVMSRSRFLAITWNIHMSDPAEDAFNDSRKGTDDYDCLHRTRPLYDSLRIACKAAYQPQQNLSVDERMLATLKQHMKNKPTKWGIKLFVLSDNTGYTVDFNIFTGKSVLNSGKGLSFDAVMSLVDKSFLGPGYHIYCDNFYTSPALFLHLHGLGFGACGTFQDTRSDIPRTRVNALTKKSPRGTIRWIRDGALTFIKWMDKKEVNVCSTVHVASSRSTVKRVCKVGGKDTEVEVPLPAAVKDYNLFMAGVHLSEQLISSYSCWRKSRKWYAVVLHHFIDIAATNSYLLHKALCSRLDQRPMTHQAFQEQLAAELCAVPAQPPPEKHQHIPVAIVEGASGPKKATQGRRKCRLCGKSTPFMCEACTAPLCVILDRNCHKSFHSFIAPLDFEFEYEL